MAMSAHALTHSLATRRPLSARRAAWAYKARSCRPAPCCSAAQGANGSSSGGGSPPADAAGAEAYQFTYKGSDGRLKATFEQAFKGYRRGSDDMGSASDSEADAPWALGYQMSEAGLMWNDQLKARLIKVRMPRTGAVRWIPSLLLFAVEVWVPLLCRLSFLAGWP